jgi:cobalamin-dependent methionine synthase I
MFKESFDPEVKTVIGLSNISNGSYKEYRPLLNKVFLTLALGAGLDTAILDGADNEIINIFKALKGEDIQIPEIYRKIYDMSQNFGDIEDIDYNKEDFEEYKVVQAARILLNKEIYSHSFIKEN